MNLLYHYTTVDALIGMTANMSESDRDLTMWATDIICMNDPKEKVIGTKLFDSLLGKIEEKLNIPINRRASLLRDSNEIFKEGLYCDDTDVFSFKCDMYVTSFSKSEDSLPMWSMYAKNGNGVSLGFDFELMHEKYSKDNFLFGQIVYDNVCEKDLELLFITTYDVAYKKTENIFRNLKNCIPNENFDTLLSLTVYKYYTLIVSSFIKHHSYEYENEFRVCCINNPMKFRSSNGFIVPYIEYKLPIDFLKKIIIGPTLDYERIVYPLSKLLRSKGIDMSKIEIEKSKIPYRI